VNGHPVNEVRAAREHPGQLRAVGDQAVEDGLEASRRNRCLARPRGGPGGGEEANGDRHEVQANASHGAQEIGEYAYGRWGPVLPWESFT